MEGSENPPKGDAPKFKPVIFPRERSGMSFSAFFYPRMEDLIKLSPIKGNGSLPRVEKPTLSGFPDRALGKPGGRVGAETAAMRHGGGEPKEQQYGEIFFDKTKIFHGVGYDTLRFASILEHGILSERAAQEKGLDVTRNYGGYNLDDTVSMTASPSEHGTYTFGAFRSYVKDCGIGLVVDRRGLQTFAAPPMQETGSFHASARASGYIDEVYVTHEVPPQNIVGVMVPEEMLDKPISELPLGLSEMGYGFVDNRCKKIIADVEQKFVYKADTSSLEELMRKKWELETSRMGYLEKEKARKELVDGMDKFMGKYLGQAYAQDMGKAEVTLRDVMGRYLPENMKVYNSDGYPLDAKPGSSQEK